MQVDAYSYPQMLASWSLLNYRRLNLLPVLASSAKTPKHAIHWHSSPHGYSCPS